MPAEVNDSLHWLQGVLDEVPILGYDDIKVKVFWFFFGENDGCKTVEQITI